MTDVFVCCRTQFCKLQTVSCKLPTARNRDFRISDPSSESFKVTKPLFNIWIPPFTSSQLKNWGCFPDSKELQCWWQTSKDILQTVLPVLVKNKWLTTCCSWTFWTFAADLGFAVLESRTSQQEEEKRDWQLPSSVFWEQLLWQETKAS